MTASPARIARQAPALRAPPRSRHSRRGGSEGRACHSARISGPQQNTRSMPLASTGSARPRCSARPFGAEFQHVAEHGDAPAARPDRRLAEQRERGAHRGRIGVVAFVDQQRRAAGQVRASMRAPRPRAGCELGERQRREREIGADQRGRRQHGERIVHEMAARRAELVGHVVAEDVGLDGRAVRMQRAFDRAAHRRSRARRTRRCARRRRVLRAALEMRELRDCRD